MTKTDSLFDDTDVELDIGKMAPQKLSIVLMCAHFNADNLNYSLLLISLLPESQFTTNFAIITHDDFLTIFFNAN